jgi:hypothetical protein
MKHYILYAAQRLQTNLLTQYKYDFHQACLLTQIYLQAYGMEFYELQCYQSVNDRKLRAEL